MRAHKGFPFRRQVGHNDLGYPFAWRHELDQAAQKATLDFEQAYLKWARDILNETPRVRLDQEPNWLNDSVALLQWINRGMSLELMLSKLAGVVPRIRLNGHSYEFEEFDRVTPEEKVIFARRVFEQAKGWASIIKHNDEQAEQQRR